MQHSIRFTRTTCSRKCPIHHFTLHVTATGYLSKNTTTGPEIHQYLTIPHFIIYWFTDFQHRIFLKGVQIQVLIQSSEIWEALMHTADGPDNDVFIFFFFFLLVIKCRIQTKRNDFQFINKDCFRCGFTKKLHKCSLYVIFGSSKMNCSRAETCFRGDNVRLPGVTTVPLVEDSSGWILGSDIYSVFIQLCSNSHIGLFIHPFSLPVSLLFHVYWGIWKVNVKYVIFHCLILFLLSFLPQAQFYLYLSVFLLQSSHIYFWFSSQICSYVFYVLLSISV